ncbi:MAG TPA: putative Ig domain-containing protein [Pedobacter sp.]|uniref:putative Ig domain-containing protein n=1 Tax=Pedobacter sp. TaxID=1411316 RepID=UPI002BA2F21C|nr:putative Ig domain-containing protein [Pedobacter sp.]HMI02020.1 putative Ig domain-containing protein [Pedobacter sp.]
MNKRSGKKIIYLLLFATGIGLSFKNKSYPAKPLSKSWFAEMFKANITTDSAKWSGLKCSQTWDELRGRYNDPVSLMEMTWEERDHIWQRVLPSGSDKYRALAGRYWHAYLGSCNERGIKPLKFDTTPNSLKEVTELRKIYLASRKAEYVILTPKPRKQPQINSAGVYGVRPGSEIIYRIAATGAQPIKYIVSGLPAGCRFDTELGVIRGAVAKEGKYNFVITVRNKYGESHKDVTLVVGQTIALTPPMGWNSWNSFACNVTATDIKNTADQLIKTGLADYGWSYINIDDCWMKVPDIANMPEGKEKALREPYHKANVDFRIKTKKVRFNEQELIGDTRDVNGNVLANKDFPDMRSLTDYLHKYGFKAGLYSSPGPLTCQRYEGSYKHEYADAKQFAEWGFDYLKYDWCGYRSVVSKPSLEEVQYPYRLMGQALKEADRDIVYSLCQYGMKDVWKWGAPIGGNVWRTTGDIRDNWENMSRIGFNQAGLESYAGPGHWNDPDMLVVGYVGWSKNLRPTYLSPNEQYTHISLWSLLAAPLLIGCDLTRLDDFTYGLLSNPEVIAVNQDILGKQASRVIRDKNIQVWSKQLLDGSIAVGVFNLGEIPVDYQLSLAALQLRGKHTLRDLWKQEDMGSIEISFSVPVNRHGVKLFKIK